MRPIAKAFAYITRGEELLLFRHLDFPEAGLQVPAGTVRPRETPKAAALREAREETGLETLTVRGALGSVDADMMPFGKPEVHRRHFFHLTAPGPLPDEWLHTESDPEGEAGGPPVRLGFFWVRLAEAPALLVAGHGALLSRLRSPAEGEAHLARVRRLCSGFPQTVEKRSHGEATFFCPGGVYAMFSNNHHYDGRIAVWVPAGPGQQEEWIEAAPDRYFRPPYVGKAGWAGIDLDRVDDEELGERLTEAWRLISRKRR